MKSILSAAVAIVGLLQFCACAHADAIPTVTVTGMDGNAKESGKAASFLFTREAAAIDKPLSVTFSLSGSATAGADYGNPGTSVTFAAFSPFASVKISPVKDALAEGNETVVLTLAPQKTYTIGADKAATLIIEDSTASSGPAENRDDTRQQSRIQANRSGSLAVTISFDGAGRWKHPSNGAYSNMKFHRELTYTVPLTGMYGGGSGFQELDRKEINMDVQRYLVGRPTALMSGAGGPCGKGSVTVLDESSGMEVGDPGQPPLVPFKQQIAGGGEYPSGDKTVPERDLCMTVVSIDNVKHLLNLRIDGTDTHVKVVNTHNGHVARPYNLRLQGEDPQAKTHFTLLSIPIGANALSVDGSKQIPNVSYVHGPMNSQYPLSATVRWRVTFK
ncbi:MAG TPA: Calx-beta domain-containing protein [Steroidobacteraceae bacterium]|nr:Calx-beta domain-containing protein [Steroidobacteraceae bacterium]